LNFTGKLWKKTSWIFC